MVSNKTLADITFSKSLTNGRLMRLANTELRAVKTKIKLIKVTLGDLD